ncbi:hypothetical protein ACVIGB_000006 [Bradyrhizobium sp. USDA 4341]
MKTLITWSLLASFASCSAAQADWKIDTQSDRISDKAIKRATLNAKAADNGVTASLLLTCDGLDGTRLFSVQLSSTFSPRTIPARLRIDENKVRTLLSLGTYGDPHRIPIITAPSYDLWGRKRFRIQLSPRGGPELFYDFDLTGIGKAIAALPCNKAPTETFEDTAGVE